MAPVTENIYKLRDADRIQTPALLVFPELVDANIKATLQMMGGDADRWRPHIKTAKIASVIRQMIAHGVQAFKCSTTLELLTACEAGAQDVLLAFPVTGANAKRTIEIAKQFPNVKISALIESEQQTKVWASSPVGSFIDVNSGMNRTGISQDRSNDIQKLARQLGSQFRGLHYYDGHVSEESSAQTGYDRLIELVKAVGNAEEVITSGTPSTPAALSHKGLSAGPFRHRVSPGTVVYNDLSSIKQLPNRGYTPAVVVLATIVSHPTPNVITCDAGHKSVSVDCGVPNCAVAGHERMNPLKPSEEHLPIECAGDLPPIGTQLYLIPRHVCPTVNNFDEALMIVNGEIKGVEKVTARGHERPIPAESHDNPVSSDS